MRMRFFKRFMPTMSWRKLAIALIALSFSQYFTACYSPPQGGDKVKFEAIVGSQIQEDFKRTFIEYWAARSRLDWNVLYNMEAPHVKWAYTQDKFINIRAKAPKVTLVVAKGIKKLADNSYRISIELTLKDPVTGNESTVYPEDIWVQNKGKWWHVWRIGMIEKFI